MRSKKSDTTKQKKSTTRSKKKVSVKKIRKVDKTLNTSLDKISYEVINQGFLSSVKIKNDANVSFENSWTEFILNLLGMVWEQCPYKFMSTLVKYGVLSDGVNLSRDVSIHAPSSGIEYEIYRLSKESGYYVELRRDPEKYLEAILGLTSALGIEHKEVYLTIEPLNAKINNKYSEVKLVEKKENIHNLLSSDVVYSINEVNEIEIMSISQKVESLNQALYIFIIQMILMNDDKALDTIISCNLGDVGITDIKHIDEYDERFNKVELQDYYIYSTKNTREIIKFISKVAVKFNIPDNLINLKFKAISIE